MLYPVHLQLETNDFCNDILVDFLNKQFEDKCCWQQPFSPTLKWCLGCLAWVRNGGHIHFPSLPSLLELGIGTRHPASVPVTPILRSYMPLTDTSPEYWPHMWQAALRFWKTLTSPTFLPLKWWMNQTNERLWELQYFMFLILFLSFSLHSRLSSVSSFSCILHTNFQGSSLECGVNFV